MLGHDVNTGVFCCEVYHHPTLPVYHLSVDYSTEYIVHSTEVGTQILPLTAVWPGESYPVSVSGVLICEIRIVIDLLLRIKRGLLISL